MSQRRRTGKGKLYYEFNSFLISSQTARFLPAASTVFGLALISLLGLIGFWFLIAVVVFLVKMLRAMSTQDVIQKKLYRSQAWWVLVYPIVAFIVFAAVGFLLIIL